MLYDWTLRGSCAIASSRWLIAAGTLVATVYLLRPVPKGSSRTRTPARSSASPKRRRTSRSTPWCSQQQQVAAILAEDPEHRGAFTPASAAAAAAPSRQHRPHLHPPQAPRERADSRRRSRSSSGLRPKLNADPRHPHLPAEPAAGPHRRTGQPQPVPVHAAGPDIEELYRAAPIFEKACARCPASPDVTSDLQISQPAGQRRHRPRPGLRPGRHRRPDRERALQRLRLAPGLDHLHRRPTTTGSSWSCCRSTSAIPARSSMLYVRVQRAASWCR